MSQNRRQQQLTQLDGGQASNSVPEPKVSIFVGGLILTWVLVLDIIGIILGFFGVDDFFILDVLSFPATVLYFSIKGVDQSPNITSGLGELIPYVGALPLRTIGVAMVLWTDRHPKSAVTAGLKSVGQITSKANIAKGKVPTSGAQATNTAAKTSSAVKRV